MRPLNENPQLLHLLEQYSPPGENYVHLLTDIENRNKSSEMIVPILGKQGEGKSTLINALLQEDILPSEADETTCVPVEIRYGVRPHCEVHFQGSTAVSFVSTKQELSEFVDNNYNPGNTKNISHIVVFRNLPLLESGLVLVDLPGVGSLTYANEETTNRYIQNLTAAIFIIPTSPPILKSDAIFIKTVWRRFNSAYFVQNVWEDSEESDIRDGLEHNDKILRSIASEINVPMIHDIIPVNAYSAAKGAIQKQDNLMMKSGIFDLVTLLIDFSHNYIENQNRTFEEHVRLCINSAINQVEGWIEKTQMSANEVMEQMMQEQKKFDTCNRQIDNLVIEINQQISSYKREINKFSRDISKKYSELLRVDIFHLIDEGVVDGEQLSEAFNDYQTTYGNMALDEIYEFLGNIWEKLSEKFELISQIASQDNDYFNFDTINKSQSFKWEKGLDAAGKIASSIGGVAIGGAIGGPIGLAVTLGIALVGGWLSGKMRQGITATRGNETKRELIKYIYDFRDQIKSVAVDAFDVFSRNITENLKGYVDKRKLQLQSIKDSIQKFKQNGYELDYKLEDLKRDKQYLEDWRNQTWPT